jgi:hypothetical protein
VGERLDEANLLARVGIPNETAFDHLVEIIQLLKLMLKHNWRYVQAANWWCDNYRNITDFRRSVKKRLKFFIDHGNLPIDGRGRYKRFTLLGGTSIRGSAKAL